MSVLIVEVIEFFLPFSLGRSMVSSALVVYLFQVLSYRKCYIKFAALSLFYMLLLAMSDFSILVVCSMTSGKPFDAFLTISVYRVIATVIHTLVLSFVVYLIYHISENTFRMGKRYVISLLVLSILILVLTLLIFQYFCQWGISVWRICLCGECWWRCHWFRSFILSVWNGHTPSSRKICY